MKYLVHTIITICLFAGAIQAQVGINILIPDSSAILHLESDDRGFLPPTMTTAERNAISNPASGLVIFNEEDSLLQYFNGECWINTFQRNCRECGFNVSLSNVSSSIDRTSSDSASTQITVTQTTGSGADITLFVLSSLPSGITATLDSSTVDSVGTVNLSVYASIFAAPGTYPIIIQSVCGSETKFVVYQVTVEPCVIVDITSSKTDYDLQADESLPGVGTPVCVVVNVLAGAELNSSDAATPAFSLGNLDGGSHVGILNDGAIIGRGGDGGFGGSFAIPPGDPGKVGGHALDLSCRTTLQNNGYILGGGSGGGSVGISFSVSIPIIGSLTIGASAGGGGGSANGVGGTVSGGVSLGVFDDGTDATGGTASVPGVGGDLSTTISIPITPVTINIIPSGGGGDGADFGDTGDAGFVDLDINVAVPIIGTIPIPIPGGIVPAFGPVSAGPGNAIKRNGNNLIGLPDGTYSTGFVKGVVGL